MCKHGTTAACWQCQEEMPAWQRSAFRTQTEALAEAQRRRQAARDIAEQSAAAVGKTLDELLEPMLPHERDNFWHDVNELQLEEDMRFEQNKEDWIERQRESRKKARLITAEAVDKLQSPVYLIDKLLVRNSVAQLVSTRGLGKTFLASDWAYHVAAGAPWMGLKIQKPEAVLYVVAEGEGGLKKRQQAWAQEHSGLDISLANFYVAPVNLSLWREVQEFIDEVVKVIKPALVIFDTQARCTVGADENSATDMGRVMDNVNRIREASKACCLLLHHSGYEKAGRGRGSSAVPAALDTEMLLTSEDDRGDDVFLKLDVTKQRDDEGKGMRIIRRRVDIGDTGDSSCIIASTEALGVPVPMIHVTMAPGDVPHAHYQVAQAIQVLEKLYADGTQFVAATEWKNAAGFEGKHRDSVWNDLRKEAVYQGLVAEIPGPPGGDARKKYYKPVSLLPKEKS